VGISVLVYTVITTTATFYVETPFSLFLWGAFIGGCISTMGSLSNLFVQSSFDASRRGQMMSALHSLYGLSSFFAPWIAGIVLVQPENWQYLFAAVAPAAAGLAGLVFLKGPPSGSPESRRAAAQPMSLERIHVLTIFVLIAYVLGEVLTSTWMPSFLVQTYGLSIKDASFYTSMFFGAMLVTRVACGIWARPRYHRWLIWVSLIGAFVCFVAARLTGWLWLLPMTGVFGPFFPLYVTWVSLRFPERDRSMIIWMLSGMQATLSVMNLAVGKLADVAGFEKAYWVPGLMIFMTMILLKILELRDHGAQDNQN
jgi:fucose permease